MGVCVCQSEVVGLCVPLCMCVWFCMYVKSCLYAGVCVCVCVCVCMYVCACVKEGRRERVSAVRDILYRVLKSIETESIFWSLVTMILF